MTVLDWLLKTSISAVPSAVLIWVNKLVGFFKNSPEIALRAWRSDADSTAAGFGTLIVIVLAVSVSLLPRRWMRAILAVAFALLTGIALYKCYNSFTLLDTVRMSDTDARAIQAAWRCWYIALLCSFVAAMTCAFTTIWPGTSE
jgi:hypothetical protein